MNSNQGTASAISNIVWIEDGKTMHFESERGFGVRRGGAFLSFNGVRPSVWGRKAIAAEIAATVVDDGTLTWIEVA